MLFHTPKCTARFSFDIVVHDAKVVNCNRRDIDDAYRSLDLFHLRTSVGSMFHEPSLKADHCTMQLPTVHEGFSG